MKDYITISSSPVDENCAQVGSVNYQERAMKECRAFIKQLRRQFGPEVGSARLTIKAFPHDFGTYYEVVCMYEDADEQGMDYAFKLEAETPTNWDEEAKPITRPFMAKDYIAVDEQILHGVEDWMHDGGDKHLIANFIRGLSHVCLAAEIEDMAKLEAISEKIIYAAI